LVTLSGRQACVWEIQGHISPPAEDLADLAEAVAGQRFNDRGLVESISQTRLVSIRTRLQNPADNTPYSIWTQWFLAERSNRRISPQASMSVSAYVEQALQDNTVESLREAIRLCPTNGLAFAKLALRSRGPDAKKSAEADFLKRRAIQVAPDDAQVAGLLISKPVRPSPPTGLRGAATIFIK
jgi:hypothetical protein